MHIRCLFNQYDDICMRVSVPDGTFNEVGTTENQPGYPIFQQTQMQIEITINHWDLTWKTWKTWFEAKKWWLRHYIVIEFSYGKRRCPKKHVIFSYVPPKKHPSYFLHEKTAEQLSAVPSSPQCQGLRLLGRSLMARDEGDGTNPVARSGRTDTIFCRAEKCFFFLCVFIMWNVDPKDMVFYPGKGSLST